MEKLNILWTSKDKDTFMYMVAMYASNSIKSAAWDKVNIIIWGASTRLSGEDIEVQNELQKLIENGVTVEACKACADKMKLTTTLKDLGITVKYMSKLTGLIKGKEHLITI
ncbi:DsrE family protein [Aureibaculum luteum]|uniref:DsrE family protein n=1 Tax=Aureibaculum luteum TaxID=1548456 RepID=UPI0013007506|nr:DsrE family protein [Aureibaculum luteum]